MKKEHYYSLTIQWTGNTGLGAAKYSAYERSFVCRAVNKPDISGSSDPDFRGDKRCWNPEELLVSSLASCHMLWYLHSCADAHIIIQAYEDFPIGRMLENLDGAGAFTEVILRPVVKLADQSQAECAMELHAVAHAKCFIANSVNFPVLIEPSMMPVQS